MPHRHESFHDAIQMLTTVQHDMEILITNQNIATSERDAHSKKNTVRLSRKPRAHPQISEIQG